MAPSRASALAVALLFAVIAPQLRGQERVDYLKSVKPILTAHCYSCHGGLKQMNRLRVDTVALMMKGGESGAILEAGNSSKSLIVDHVTVTRGAPRMPPASEGELLKPAEIALIRKWIDEGAAGPPDEKPEADVKSHWAFKAPVKAAPPKPGNPIDAFLAAEREKHGLKAQALADKRVLLRRVYLDLIGLPPTREEQDAFEKEYAAKPQAAYEAVVERLLSSKQYGERWGRHWMDVWRYSDWWGLGVEVRNSQKHMWHWRDWIIESLNGDKGYDQMLREMLAADELYPSDADKLRGNGFLARQYFIFNRNTWMEDAVEHTAKAFLGLTVNCSKCHDHKYDPIAQADFYRFRAFFEPYQVRLDMAPGETDFAKNGIPRGFDCNHEAPTYLFIRGDEKQPRKDKPIPPGVPDILTFGSLDIAAVKLPAEAVVTGLRKEVVDSYLHAADVQIKTARETLAQARKTLADVEKKRPPIPAKEQTTELKNKPIASDNFSKEKTDQWEMKSGEWKYQDGKLKQTKDGPVRGQLRLKAKPPEDFEARFKFTITGGQMWKSVGLLFDTVDANEVNVYLSAYGGGPKLQITYKQGGKQVYPAEATQLRPIKVGETQDVTVRVRGTLVNVAINGQHALAYRLPIPRKPDGIELITYDALVDFTMFELSPLDNSVKLLEDSARVTTGKSVEMTLEQARLAVVVAEKALAAAELQVSLINARTAADRARFQQPPPAETKKLARAAARIEKQAAVVAGEEAVARGELDAVLKKPDAAKKLAAARELLAKAKKELESPGESYTSLKGSLKAPENNLETPASREKPFPDTSTGRRSALAKWMTDARNPLTARVAVNHIWARHFGRPLVATVFDFGRKGAVPTHPELLDYLAVELIEKNWSMKHLHRLIVTSSAYQMSSSARLDNPKSEIPNPQLIDAENRYLWRMNPVRMESQVLRDSLLSLSGELDLTMGGPSIPIADETSRRRSLYFVHSHNDRQRFLSNFDDANVLECYRRAESIVPQQALALENSKLATAVAEKIAKRIDAADDAMFIKAAFELVLGSSPTPQELKECAEAMKELREIALRDKKADAVLRVRVNLVHALLNHNDFVTVR